MLTQLLNRIDSYLLGHISVNYLEDWLVSNLQKLLDSGDQDAIDIGNKVDADLVEFNEGLIDEVMIREYLQSYMLNKQTVFMDYGQISFDESEFSTASTASTTIKKELSITLVGDYRFQEVFG